MKSTSSSHEKVNTKIFENAEDNIERRPFIWIKSEHELFFVNMNCRVRFVFKQFEQLATMFGYEFFDLVDQSGQIVGLAELDENQPFEKMKKFIKISAEFFLIVRKDESDWELWSQMPEEKPLQKLIEKRLSELKTKAQIGTYWSKISTVKGRKTSTGPGWNKVGKEIGKIKAASRSTSAGSSTRSSPAGSRRASKKPKV